MSFKFYKHGKDAETLPCVELPSGEVITESEILLATIKLSIQKGVYTLAELKAMLGV